MYLISYKFKDNDIGTGWDIEEISLKRNNLLVGVSGSGKSRLLNSIWNVGNFISTDNFRDGVWDIRFKIDEDVYHWTLHSETKDEKNTILSEQLTRSFNSNEDIIFSRDENNITFMGDKLPKLPKEKTAIFMLKDEDVIAPVYEGFGKIYRRSFFGPDLMDACSIAEAPRNISDKNSYQKLKYDLHFINLKLYFLHKYDKPKYETITSEFKSIFPAIENISFSETSPPNSRPGIYPVTTFTEKNIRAPIYLHDLSSGMQKVLMIISDIITLKDDSIYIIDEYENSLGLNAINFLPDFIGSYGKKIQFIITSHHPYLINKMPVDDWILFTRNGSNVKITSGESFREKYKESHQDMFMQLINDPLYNGISI